MYNVFDLHRYSMTRQLRPFLDENTKATPFTPKPAYNPEKPYPYFLSKLRRSQTPLTTLPVNNPRFVPDQPVFIPNEAFNPDTWWNSAMRDRRAWVTEVEAPYYGWPRMTLEHGVNV